MSSLLQAVIFLFIFLKEMQASGAEPAAPGRQRWRPGPEIGKILNSIYLRF